MTLPRGAVAIAALLGLAGAAHAAPRGADDTLSVNDPRPLAEAVKLIEQRCGCPITYEDSVYTLKDAVDISGQVANSRSGPLIPAGGVFTFTTRLSPGDANPDHVADALHDLLVAYSLTGFPGRYRLTKSNDFFHVAPEHSVLDTPITIRLENASASGALDAILIAVEEASGTKIGLGGIASNVLMQQRVNIDVAGRPASEALMSVLAQVDNRSSRLAQRLSWRLFYQIGWGYALNLQTVVVASGVP